MTARATNAETFYHFTPEKTWPLIEREGLVPQPIKSFHPDMREMCDQLGVPRLGIYIWPLVTKELLRDFFIFKQTHDRSVASGLILAVEVDPQYMLGRR